MEWAAYVRPNSTYLGWVRESYWLGTRLTGGLLPVIADMIKAQVVADAVGSTPADHAGVPSSRFLGAEPLPMQEARAGREAVEDDITRI